MRSQKGKILVCKFSTTTVCYPKSCMQMSLINVVTTHKLAIKRSWKNLLTRFPEFHNFQTFLMTESFKLQKVDNHPESSYKAANRFWTMDQTKPSKAPLKESYLSRGVIAQNAHPNRPAVKITAKQTLIVLFRWAGYIRTMLGEKLNHPMIEGCY